MNHKLLITTGCCSNSLKHKVVRLSFDIDYDNFVPYSESKPIWVAKGFHEFESFGKSYITENYVEVKCCPFCGQSVPELEINDEATKLKIHDSDMDYCTTCDDRNMSCRCLPPEFRWKPVGVDVELPIIEQYDDEE